MRRCEFSIHCKEINNAVSPQAKEAQTLPAQERMKPEDDAKDTSHVWISALITCLWSPEREKGWRKWGLCNRTLHRLTHGVWSVPRGEPACPTASQRGRQAELLPQTLNHPALKWEKSAKIGRKILRIFFLLSRTMSQVWHKYLFQEVLTE